jgi:hypothetical protein
MLPLGYGCGLGRGITLMGGNLLTYANNSLGVQTRAQIYLVELERNLAPGP